MLSEELDSLRQHIADNPGETIVSPEMLVKLVEHIDDQKNEITRLREKLSEAVTIRIAE